MARRAGPRLFSHVHHSFLPSFAQELGGQTPARGDRSAIFTVILRGCQREWWSHGWTGCVDQFSGELALRAVEPCFECLSRAPSCSLPVGVEHANPHAYCTVPISFQEVAHVSAGISVADMSLNKPCCCHTMWKQVSQHAGLLEPDILWTIVNSGFEWICCSGSGTDRRGVLGAICSSRLSGHEWILKSYRPESRDQYFCKEYPALPRKGLWRYWHTASRFS